MGAEDEGPRSRNIGTNLKQCEANYTIGLDPPFDLTT